MPSKVSHKIAALVFLTGFLPLVFFGAYAILKADATARETVRLGNSRLAVQVAGRIDQYMQNARAILESLAETLGRTELEPWQRDKILRSHSIKFDHFQMLNLHGLDGALLATSELTPDDAAADVAGKPEFLAAAAGRFAVSDVFMTRDLVPAVEMFLPARRLDRVEGVLAVRVDLLHLWRLADELKVGSSGYVSIMTASGKLFASGSGAAKIDAIRLSAYPAFEKIGAAAEEGFRRASPAGPLWVFTARAAAPYAWVVAVEQPEAEAFALPREMTEKLAYAAAGLLVFALAAGLFVARREILRPMEILVRRVREISGGTLHGTVELRARNEFGEFAATLNRMSGDLIVLQQEVVRKEKQALLGRIASSIAHDLKHPVTSVENYTRLLEVKHADADYRRAFLDTVKREFERIHAFLSNLKDLSKEIPFRPVKMPVAAVVESVLTSLKPLCDERGVTPVFRRGESDPVAYLDMLSFQRVLNNLMHNAVEAMPDGGRLEVALDESGDGEGLRFLSLRVGDTGCGIAAERLPGLFEDLRTTKKTGLGLGLAITQKIVAQHGGRIEVESEVGAGTRFTVLLPAA